VDYPVEQLRQGAIIYGHVPKAIHSPRFSLVIAIPEIHRDSVYIRCAGITSITNPSSIPSHLIELPYGSPATPHAKTGLTRRCGCDCSWKPYYLTLPSGASDYQYKGETDFAEFDKIMKMLRHLKNI
jgi:hypothetical protein